MDRCGHCVHHDGKREYLPIHLDTDAPSSPYDRTNYGWHWNIQYLVTKGNEMIAKRSFALFKIFKTVGQADFMAVLILNLSSLLFFYDLLGERNLLTERDLAPYFIPPRFFWVESLKNWDFPLWNPYQFSGHPFLANPQHGLLYPLNLIFLILPFDLAFNAIIILHFFLVGLSTYFLLKDLGAKPTGSLIAGLVLMLSGYLLSVHSLLNILLSVTWTPLILLFFRRAMMNPGIWNELITALLISLSFLGGGIEVVYGNFFVLLIMVLFSSTPLPNGEKGIKWIPQWILRFRTLLIVSFLFIFLSAIQLLPFIELWMHSIRGQGITYQEATIWSFAPKDALLFFLPDAYGYFLDMNKYWVTQCWLKTMYTGGLPFLLSSFFFLFGTNRKLFLSLMLFSLFLSLGQYNPLYPFVYQYVPFFNGIRYPVKFLYIFILCLAITAGLGFEKLRQFSKERRSRIFKHSLMIFPFLSGLILLFLVLGHGTIEAFLKAKGVDFPNFNHLSVNLYHAKRFFFYLTLFLLLIRVGYEIGWKGWINGLLLFFLIADLFGNMGFYGKEKTEDYFKKTKVLEIITSDPEPFRVFSTAKTTLMETPVLFVSETPFDVLKEKGLPSFCILYRIRDVWGIDVVRLKRGDDLYKAFTGMPSFSSSNLPTLLGIKYVVSVTPIEDPRFKLIYARLEGLEGDRDDLLKQNTIKLYRNKHPVRRAWFVQGYRVMDSQTILNRLISKDFSPEKEVLLEEEPPLPIGQREGGLRGGKVEFLSETNNRLTLRVETETESILVLNDTYYPGWKVFVNGREKKIIRANYKFRAVAIEKGRHRIEFVYDPISVKLGTGITLAGFAGILLAGAFSQRKRSTPKQERNNETFHHHSGL